MCVRPEVTEQTGLPAVASAAECVHEIMLPHDPAVFGQLPEIPADLFKSNSIAL